MDPRIRSAAAFACMVAVTTMFALARSATVAAGGQARPIVLGFLGTADGMRYRYEISQEKAASLPAWDSRTSPEPPLSMSAARQYAQAWLASQIPDAKRFDLQTFGLFRSMASGIWYYRVAFNPMAAGRPMTDLPKFTVVVLLDGSIVQGTEASGVAPPPTAPSAPVSGAAGGRGNAASGSTGDSTAYRPGNDVIAPRVLSQSPTRYTDAALKAKIQGSVLLDVVVNTDGTVGDVTVVRSLDTVNGLDEEAMKAARQWRFAPGTRMGVPVRTVVTLEMTFKLR